MASITRRNRATTDTSLPAAMDRLVEAFERLLARAGLHAVRWTSFSNLDAPALTRALRRRGLGPGALAGVLGRVGALPLSWLDRAGLGTSFEVYARRR